jgi:acyl carrier protein
MDSQIVRITEIWKRVLNVSTVTEEDNFIESGGDSLQAAQFIATVRSEAGADVPVRKVFNETFAAIIAEAEKQRS